MQPGQTLLHYRLVEKIGEGGMGVVWKAIDTSLDRHVAIKLLPEVFAQDPERLARFEREARLLASLSLSWNAKGQIIFSPNSNAGIHLIDGSGGTASQITTPDPDIPDGSHRWPCFLPDGEHFLRPPR